MKFDFHTHHERCGHATHRIQDYIESAIENGLQMIGISDHSPFFAQDDDHPHPGAAMGKSEFPCYVTEVLRLKEVYRDRIEVLLGVESDFFPEHYKLYKNIYEQYPLDYIIGSVHLSGGKSIFHRTRWKDLTEEQSIQEKEVYYDLIQQSARSGMFDILGHIDAMKSYYPQFSALKTNAVDRTLQVIADCDVAIEVNTSGKIKDCRAWHPVDEILERALFFGVKVTFGSDAHKPNRVGDEWELVRSRLKEIGFTEWAIFRERRRYMLKL